jgi:hypothetical protein
MDAQGFPYGQYTAMDCPRQCVSIFTLDKSTQINYHFHSTDRDRRRPPASWVVYGRSRQTTRCGVVNTRDAITTEENDQWQRQRG